METLSPIRLGSNTGPGVFWGSGSPEGVQSAPVASTYHRIDGGTGTSLYRKESGTGNTGWVANLSVTEVTVTFAAPSRGAFFNVTVSGATIGQKVICSPSLNMPAGVAQDELEMDPIIAYGHVTTTGQVRLFVGSSQGGVLGGARNINISLA